MSSKALLLLLICSAALVTRRTNAQTLTLDCDFDSNGFCNWENDADDDFDWRTGQSVAVDGWHSIPRTVTGTGQFAYAQGRFRPTPVSNDARAILRSPEISGLTAAATLSFNYWKTAVPPTLQICTQDQGSTKFRCLDSIQGAGPQSWTRRVVTIPANPLTFQILFIAGQFNTEIDLLGVDDITFRVSSGQLDYNTANRQSLGFGRPYNELDRPLFRRTEFPFTNGVGGGHGGIPPNFPPAPAPRAPAPQNWVQSGPQDAVDRQFLEQITAPPPPSATPNQLTRLGATVQQTFTVTRQPEPGTRRPPLAPVELPNDLQAPPVDQPNRLASINTNSINQPAQFPTTGGDNRRIGACRSVSCDFSLDTCNWNPVYQTNYDWKIYNTQTRTHRDGIPGSKRNSYLYANGGARYSYQRAAIYSDKFIVPQGAFLEFFVYFSNPTTGRLSVYQNVDTSLTSSQSPFESGSLLWQMTGYEQLGALGWTRVRIALRSSSFPMTLIIMADDLSSAAHFIGIDSVALVDLNDKEIGCTTDLNTNEAVHNIPAQRIQVSRYGEPQQFPRSEQLVRLASDDPYQHSLYGTPSKQPVHRRPSSDRLANLSGPRVIRIKALSPVEASRTPTASVQHHTVVEDGSEVNEHQLKADLRHSHLWQNNVDLTRQAAQSATIGNIRALPSWSSAQNNPDDFHQLEGIPTQRHPHYPPVPQDNTWGAPFNQAVYPEQSRPNTSNRPFPIHSLERPSEQQAFTSRDLKHHPVFEVHTFPPLPTLSTTTAASSSSTNGPVYPRASPPFHEQQYYEPGTPTITNQQLNTIAHQQSIPSVPQPIVPVSVHRPQTPLARSGSLANLSSDQKQHLGQLIMQMMQDQRNRHVQQQQLIPPLLFFRR